MRWFAVTVLATGCSYPEYAFAPRDAAVDSVVIDSVTQDSLLVDSSVPPETTAGTAMLDTRPDATTDSGTKPDTTADTAKDAPADTPMLRECDLKHTYCNDFDISTSPATGWDGNFTSAGATTVLDTTTYTSASTSLLASVGTSATTAAGMVSKNLTVATSSSSIRVEVDIKLDSLSYGGPGNVIILKLQRSDKGDGVSLTVGTSGLTLEAQGSGTVKWPVTGVTAGKWFHVRLDAVLHTTAGSAKVWIDDMTTPKVDKSGLSSAEVDDTSRQVLFGLFAYLGSSPFKAHYDDASFDLP